MGFTKSSLLITTTALVGPITGTCRSKWKLYVSTSFLAAEGSLTMVLRPKFNASKPKKLQVEV